MHATDSTSLQFFTFLKSQACIPAARKSMSMHIQSSSIFFSASGNNVFNFLTVLKVNMHQYWYFIVVLTNLHIFFSICTIATGKTVLKCLALSRCWRLVASLNIVKTAVEQGNWSCVITLGIPVSKFLGHPIYWSQSSSHYPYYNSLVLFICPPSTGKINLLSQ